MTLCMYDRCHWSDRVVFADDMTICCVVTRPPMIACFGPLLHCHCWQLFEATAKCPRNRCTSSVYMVQQSNVQAYVRQCRFCPSSRVGYRNDHCIRFDIDREKSNRYDFDFRIIETFVQFVSSTKITVMPRDGGQNTCDTIYRKFDTVRVVFHISMNQDFSIRCH